MKIQSGFTFFRHVCMVHILAVIAATIWSLTEKVKPNKKNKLTEIYKLMPQGMSFCFLLDNYMRLINGRMCTKQICFYHKPLSLILNDCI